MSYGAAPILNVVLRTATLGTRFALVFVLAKYLDVALVGYYGLFTAAIAYGLLCVGLDLYVYTTREIAKVEPARQGQLLKSQAALIGLLYLVLTPVALFLLPYAGMPEFLIWWFIPILVLEHVNQELYRLLIILSQQLSASLLLFLRQGSWALVIAGLMAASKSSHNLTVVMALWTVAGAVTAAVGAWKLRSLGLGGWRERVDWPWIKKGIAVSSAFLMATLAVRGVQTFDRYWLESLAGIEIVGAYVVFFGVASALTVFLDAAIFSFRYPELIGFSHRGEYDEMGRKVCMMAFQAMAASLAFAVVCSVLLPVLLGWIDQSIYLSHMDLFYWVLAAVIAYSLSMIPHYALYALGRDRTIIASHVAALLLFAAATWVLTGISRLYAVPIGVLIAMSAVLVWKTAAYLKVFHYDARHGDSPTPGAVD